MDKVLKLPVNEYWYNLIKDGKLTHDYREIKPYWTKRLENQTYDVVEFYHRFKKDILPMRYKFEWIKKGRLVNYNMDAYIIKFGERVDNVNEGKISIDEFNEWKEEFDEYLNEMLDELKEDFIEPLGLTIEIDYNYDFTGHRWLAVYEKSKGKIRENIILVGVNYDLLYLEMKKRHIDKDSFNIEAQARITIGHEIGHGLVDYIRHMDIKDVKGNPELMRIRRIGKRDEENLVEEFGESLFPEATKTYDSDLIDVLEELSNKK